MPKRILLCMGALLLLLSACQGTSSPAADEEAVDEYIERALAGDYAGEEVTILAPFTPSQLSLFEAALADFAGETEIDIRIQSGLDVTSQVNLGLEQGTVPDIVGINQLGFAHELAAAGDSVDINTFLSNDYLNEQYSDSLLTLAEVDGRQAGVWYQVQVNSLVWYPKPQFEAAGYTLPETWDEMMALGEEIAADGVTPWCIGIFSGPATGWVVADWLEEIVLRNSGPDIYDQWVQHEIPFDDSEIERAALILGSVWFEEEFVFGGIESLTRNTWDDAVIPLYQDEPSCYLYRMGPLFKTALPDEIVVGEDIDFFYLTPIKPDEFPQPVVGTGQMFTAFSTEPAVLAVMQYLTLAESAQPLIEAGGFTAAHSDTDPDWYPTDPDRRAADIFMGASSFRYDGSQLMPEEIAQTVFVNEMTGYILGRRPSRAAEFLGIIDEAWPEEE